MEDTVEAPTQSFKHFDVVSNVASDHTNAKSTPHCPVATVKRITKEWSILQENLPNSIFVRVYESRIDLLRAAIVGASNTPYHDSLFFFDFSFPADYPSNPPLVTYRSFGLRLNPNLYDDGMVCLSLLNTWPGTEHQNWDPSGSTILQVLVSLQGLVLNSQPYFNEPYLYGGNEFKSLKYNEDVFILSCKTMLFLLRTPPIHFEEFVSSHFRERGRDILIACNAYHDGVVNIGQFYDNGSSSTAVISRKFKRLMRKLYPRLFAAFEKNGASLWNLVEQLVADTNEATPKNLKKAKRIQKRRMIVKKLVIQRKLGQNLKKLYSLGEMGKFVKLRYYGIYKVKFGDLFPKP